MSEIKRPVRATYERAPNGGQLRYIVESGPHRPAKLALLLGTDEQADEIVRCINFAPRAIELLRGVAHYLNADVFADDGLAKIEALLAEWGATETKP